MSLLHRGCFQVRKEAGGCLINCMVRSKDAKGGGLTPDTVRAVSHVTEHSRHSGQFSEPNEFMTIKLVDGGLIHSRCSINEM